MPDLRSLADSLRQVGDQLRQLTEEQRKTNKTITESIDALNTQLATMELQAGGPEPSAVSMEKARSLLGCGRTKVFDLLKSGELQRTEKRHGSRTMITVDSIERAQQQRQPNKRRASKHGHVRAGTNLRKSIRTLPLTGEPDDSDDSTK